MTFKWFHPTSLSNLPAFCTDTLLLCQYKYSLSKLYWYKCVYIYWNITYFVLSSTQIKLDLNVTEYIHLRIIFPEAHKLIKIIKIICDFSVVFNFFCLRKSCNRLSDNSRALYNRVAQFWKKNSCLSCKNFKMTFRIEVG